MKQLIILSLLFSLSTLTIRAQAIINPCAQVNAIHVVVIGSSTAAGSGPSSPDSAWVNRYRSYLQNINPQNQVTNLAIGGTTTYHVMPSWYVAPSGKPATNISNNVTAALNLGADAIILNMPSNDAANGFGIHEQMSNFITISNSSDSSQVPIWICTTQPRNGLSAAGKLIQVGVRDSIMDFYGSFAIDFWNGCADINDNILASYDSGDGVHMNNAGHAILNNRVIAAEIPNFLSDTLTYTDHVLTNLYLENTAICGDSNTILNAVIANIGQTSNSAMDINFEFSDPTLVTTSHTLINIPTPLNSCSLDTVSVLMNSYHGVHLAIQAFLINSDSDHTNDTSEIVQLYTIGHPQISAENDTICFGDSTTLISSASANSDTTIWYNAPTGGNIIAYGDSLLLNNVTSSQTYFCESVRGPLYYENTLFTTSTTTTNYNGIMFDIVALDTLTIDSLMIKINTIGQQGVVAYKRMGSHFGYESNSAAWTAWGIDTVQVNVVGDFKTVDYSDQILYPNDTLGVYLYMQLSGSKLSYQSVSNSLTFSDSQLEIASGSGITHTYGTTYYPRNFSGEVFYHHGFNPSGYCVSERIPVEVTLAAPHINLGADTILDSSQSIVLSPNLNFESYLWSNNSTSPQILVDTANFNIGSNIIWVEVTDFHGCMANDTITVTYTHISNIRDVITPELFIYPNPTNDILKIEFGNTHLKNAHVKIIDLFGKVIYDAPVSTPNLTLHLNDYSRGIYVVHFSNQDGSSIYKIVKE